MVMPHVRGLHQCLCTVSRADRLTGSNALNCFNGQIRLTRPPCHVDLKSLSPPAADPPGEQPQVKQAQAAAFFEPEIDHFVMAITAAEATVRQDRKSTRLNSSHANISYAVFCLKKK